MALSAPALRVASASLVAFAATLTSQAASAEPRAILSSHLPAIVAQHTAALVAPADPAQTMTLSVALKLRDEPGLDRFLADTYNPASPNYRHYLEVGEFADRFGPTAAEYEATVRHLADGGMRVMATSANRYMVSVQGAVADVERLFHVRMGLYRHPTQNRLFTAPDREPTLDLAVNISHVTGLDNFEPPRARAIRGAQRAGGLRASGSGPSNQFIGSDVRAAYAHNVTLNGHGQSLGLMELAGFNIADVNLYFATVHETRTVPIIGISTDGDSLTCGAGCDDSEQALDIEYAISMAPGLAQLQVYVGWTPEDVLNRMASDNTSKTLSTSWGWNANPAADDPLFKEMAAQGQSFFTASGDYSSLQASGPWPEEDANITAVGGTDLSTSGPGGAWAREQGWSSSAGGPSLDPSIRTPSYQLPLIDTFNGASRSLRNVPDVSADGNMNNFICYNHICQGGWGGTSFASPIWAAYIALANEEQAALHKPPLGFVNPILYSLAKTGVFRDELWGRSGLYGCSPGYDLVTGLGSPRGRAMLKALTGG